MQSLPETDAGLQVILQAFPDPVLTLDGSGTIVGCRTGENGLLSQPPEWFLGRRIHDVFPFEISSRFHEALKYGRAGQVIALDYPMILREKEAWFEARLVLLNPGRGVCFIRDITARKQSELSARKQLERLGALRAIDMAITTSPNLALTLSIVIHQVRAQLKVDAAAVLLMDQKTSTLEYATGDGFHTSALQHTSLKPGSGYAGQAALTGQTVRAANLGSRNNDFLRSPHFAEEGFVDYLAIPLIAKMRMLGVLEIFHRSPLVPEPDWLDFMNMLAGQAAIAIDSAVMFHAFEQSNSALTLAYDATIEGWSKALELRDRETQGHAQRVSEMVCKLAAMLGMAQEQIMQIRRGAALHDIGKMAIPDNILFKPGPLDMQEWEIMQRHPAIALELLKPIPYLAQALDIPLYHHEKWDGTGYPHGLREEQIPLPARLFAVVDVYDALTSNRPYREAWSHADAIDHIKRQSGKHFDPKVVEAFSTMIGISQGSQSAPRNRG
jgi:HD-GYP domain-containing protein (c-di-GMP phosphodiesterase class II)